MHIVIVLNNFVFEWIYVFNYTIEIIMKNGDIFSRRDNDDNKAEANELYRFKNSFWSFWIIVGIVFTVFAGSFLDKIMAIVIGEALLLLAIVSTLFWGSAGRRDDTDLRTDP